METKGSFPQENFDGQIKRARENLQVISELKEKLEILTEHVEGRKEALEEEIEESLHEAIRNARDCQEKIQENIEPRLEKVIKEKLDVIEKKMSGWKEDSLDAVREEIEKQSPDLARKVLWELDQTIVEKVKIVKREVMEAVKEEVERGTQSALAEIGETLQRVRVLSFASIGLSVLLAAAVVWLALR